MSATKRNHEEFAKRFETACDGNPHVPPQNYGRLAWVVKQFKTRFDKQITLESVRKWSAGETYPRPDAMAMLAQVLAVDQAWLALGKMNELSDKDMRLKTAEASGAVNLLAGVIQMSGCYPAFPEASDARARAEKTDLYAIIRGAQYRFHVVVGQRKDKGVVFAVPIEAIESNVVIGILPGEGFSYRFFEIDTETLLVRKRKDGAVIVSVDDAGQMPFREITSFAERL